VSGGLLSTHILWSFTASDEGFSVSAMATGRAMGSSTIIGSSPSAILKDPNSTLVSSRSSVAVSTTITAVATSASSQPSGASALSALSRSSSSLRISSRYASAVGLLPLGCQRSTNSHSAQASIRHSFASFQSPNMRPSSISVLIRWYFGIVSSARRSRAYSWHYTRRYSS
jgi:hypothetical protein